MKTSWSAAALAAVLCAVAGCGGGGGAHESGEVAVTVAPLTGVADVTRVNVSASPDGSSVDLTKQTNGSFSGLLILAPGDQLLTVKAYSGTKVVGEGSATVTVVSKQNTAVVVKVKDNTGPFPVPDRGPFVTSLTASKSYFLTGEVITLTAAGSDPDGDPITWAWTQSAGCAGTFTSPASATTTWSSPSTGACVLTATATSKGLSDAQSVQVFVAPQPAGAVTVSAIFVPNPRIDSVYLRGGSLNIWYGSIYRSAANASYPTALYAGEKVSVELSTYNVSSSSALAATLTDNCGGTATPTTGSGSYYPTFQWTAPAAGGVCKLTAGVTVEGLSDEFPIAFEVSPCTDDAYEHNDSSGSAEYLFLSGTGTTATLSVPNLWAHDEDWWAVSNVLGTLRVSLTTTDQIPVELYDAQGVLLATGVNGAEASGLARYTTVRVRVLPGARAASCDSGYSLDLVSF